MSALILNWEFVSRVLKLILALLPEILKVIKSLDDDDVVVNPQN